MSKKEANESLFENRLIEWIAEQEKSALTAKQWQLVHKVKYYLKKYKTEMAQLELEVDGAS